MSLDGRHERRRSRQRGDWADIAGMRDVLIHHYFGIDFDIVCGVLQKEIPELHHELRRIITLEEA